MEWPLEQYLNFMKNSVNICFNPYCSGMAIRTYIVCYGGKVPRGFNPYCSGMAIRTSHDAERKLWARRFNPYCSGMAIRTPKATLSN